MGKILLTCEKPNAAKDVANALDVSIKNLGGYFESDSYVITWAFGHLIRWKTPDEIDESYKTWSLDPLPFKFDINKDLTIDDDKKKQFSIIKKLINRADIDYIVNAGDADREGLLIQEEIYKFAGNKKPIKMLWTQSLTPTEILKHMSSLKERAPYLNLLEEAKARYTVDNMLGISYTRALAKTVANGNKVSYGRCQTPLLKLLSDRENNILNFVPKDYFTIKAKFDKGYTGALVGTDNNIIKFDNNETANSKLKDLSKSGTIADIKEEKKSEKAPLLFSLSELQKYMSKKYKFSPSKTLETAQKLYEAKLITYPRTDTEYINEDVYNEIGSHIEAACKYLNIDSKSLNSIEEIKRCCKDKKVTGHHAMLPTEIIAKKETLDGLSKEEMLVYDAICKRLVSMLLPDYEYVSMVITTDVSGNKFITKGLRVINEGYKALYKKEEIQKEEESDSSNEELPKLSKGDTVNGVYEIKADKTKAEARYTGDTIISLMEKAHIGTVATQANIINTLIDRGFIEYEKNKYHVTKYGLDFINIVPEELKDPQIESVFEEKLALIGEGKLSYDDFINETYETQKKEIEKLKNSTSEGAAVMKNKFLDNTSEYKCPVCGKQLKEMKFSINCDCGFKLNREIASKKLSETNINDLFTKGKTSVIKGFKKKDGNTFDCMLIIDKDKKGVSFSFNKK